MFIDHRQFESARRVSSYVPGRAYRPADVAAPKTGEVSSAAIALMAGSRVPRQARKPFGFDVHALLETLGLGVRRLRRRIRVMSKRRLRRARRVVQERRIRDQQRRRRWAEQRVVRINELLALEPRIVFDAAIAETADQMADQVAEQQAAAFGAADSARVDALVVPFEVAGGVTAAGPVVGGERPPTEGGEGLVPGEYDRDDPPALPGDGRTNDLPVAETSPETAVEPLQVVTEAGQGVEIVFIDSGVSDPDVIAAAARPGAEIVYLDAGSDGVEQIAAYLAGRSNISAIHIVSHGAPGELALGSATLNQASIAGEHADELAVIRQALTANADILIYGCDFGADLDAVAALAAATGADIAASTDDTGAAELGGDWDLEARAGDIEAAALAAPEWNGLLAPLEISASGNPVVTGTGGVGTIALWTNAGTLGGSSIDLRATVIDFTPGFAGATAPIFGTAGDDGFVQLTQQSSVTLRWEIFASGTNQTVHAVGSPEFRISDIDGIGGAPFTRESVAPQLGGLQAFTVSSPTNVQTSIVGTELLAAGTQDQNGEASSMVGFSWSEVSSWDVTYQLHINDPLIQARFLHDGDGDFTFVAPNTTFMLQLDADANNSTAPGTAYQTTFTENGAAVPVVDADAVITHHSALGAGLHSATLTLTNAQAADVLAVGALPPGITAVVDTSVAGEITVTLSGAASVADYQSALKTITFANSSENPATANRLIEVSVTNATFGTTSNIALSTISVVAVNDAPVAVDDGPVTAIPGQPLNIDVLADNGGGIDNDLEDDTIAVTGIIDPANPGVVIAIGGGNPSIVTLASGTTVILKPDGTFDIVLSPGNADTETFDYQISDGNGGTDTATVTLARDTDADGVANTVDIDDDNDGILDTVEQGGPVLAGARINLQEVLVTAGSANFSATTSDLVQLTADANNQAGTVQSQIKLDLTTDFEFSYSLNFGVNNDTNGLNGNPFGSTYPVGGADGIAFILHNDPAGSSAVGIAGASIGAGGIANGIAVEFDTFDNTLFGGNEGPIGGINFGAGLAKFDHTSIWDTDAGGTGTPFTNIGDTSVTVIGTGGEIEDGQFHDVIVRWNAAANTLTWSFDGVQVGSLTEDIANTRLGGQTSAYFGLSASTGGLRNEHQARLDSFEGNILVSTPAPDTDGDGIFDYLDIDSDNDGITDNIEAQTTDGYIAPAGLDANSNGLDDAFEVNNLVGDGVGALGPVDADGDGAADFLDTDSDDDGVTDNAENGLGQTAIANGTLSNNTNDADGDGLFDQYENAIDGNANDGFVVNEGVADPLVTGGAYLPDADGDAALGSALDHDLDFRDAANIPDTDADGVFDDIDIDDDNDGILDTVEGHDLITNSITAEFDGTFGTQTVRRDLQNPVSGYTYLPSGNTNAGQYIVNSGATPNTTWNPFGVNFNGNTTGTADDAFLVVNGSTSQGVFLQETITVPQNASVELSIDARNWAGAPFNTLGPPNLAIQIYDATGTVLLGQSQTGPISQNTSWVTAVTPFNTGANTSVIVRLVNLSTQASGNDFAIDNIRFTILDPAQFENRDTDGDGIFDHLDIDSDNDGITDNIEAQTTDGYIAPTGIFDATGVDTAYAGGLTPVDTDGDNISDYLDTDSDNDGLTDNAENGLGQTAIANGTLSDGTNDADGDGLFDQYETAIDGNANDGFVVNEGVTDPLTAEANQNGYLPDADGDAAAASPLTADLNYRDIVNPPVLDLGSTASYADTDRDFAATYQSGSAPVAIADVTADALDGEHLADFTQLTITPTSAIPDGASEILEIAGVDFPLGVDKTVGGVTIPGTSTVVDISYRDGVITIREASNGRIPNADMDTLIRSITYRNEAPLPNGAIERTFDLQVAQYDPATFVIDFEEFTPGTQATPAQIESDPYWASAAAQNGAFQDADNAGPFNQTLADNADGTYLFHNTAPRRFKWVA